MASRILFKQKAAFLFRLIALEETLDVATLEISKSQRAGNRARDEHRGAHKGDLKAGDVNHGAPQNPEHTPATFAAMEMRAYTIGYSRPPNVLRANDGVMTLVTP